jgi:hypothetical protein
MTRLPDSPHRSYESLKNNYQAIEDAIAAEKVVHGSADLQMIKNTLRLLLESYHGESSETFQHLTAYGQTLKAVGFARTATTLASLQAQVGGLPDHIPPDQKAGFISDCSKAIYQSIELDLPGIESRVNYDTLEQTAKQSLSDYYQSLRIGKEEAIKLQLATLKANIQSLNQMGFTKLAKSLQKQRENIEQMST